MLAILCYLLVAGLCAFIAERLVPGGIPGGFLVTALFGVIGAWIGGSLLGSFGPDLGGVALVPCIVGSAILVFGVSLLSRGLRHRNV